MTTITARRIKASVGVTSRGHYLPKITSLLARYPRWIHAESRTHRLLSIDEEMGFEPATPSLMDDRNFSRNASSSRAIPVSKMIEDVINDPAIPLFWYKNTKGMQGKELFSPEESEQLNVELLKDRDRAVERAMFYSKFGEDGCHKQIVNRILEPYSHINVMITATQWSNFLALRDHPDAEPHIMLLAKAIRAVVEEPDYQILQEGQWHLPWYDDPLDFTNKEEVQHAIMISLARSASLSYQTVDGKPMDRERANSLAEKLISAEPLHATPTEHQAMVSPTYIDEHTLIEVFKDRRHANFALGWVQYRQTLPNQCL